MYFAGDREIAQNELAACHKSTALKLGAWSTRLLNRLLKGKACQFLLIAT